jgi:Zn-finger nucleic acid-binding protein
MTGKEKKAGAKCPSCGTKLSSTRFLNETVDRCAKCGGMWLDGGELQRMGGRLDDSIDWPENLADYGRQLEVKPDRSMTCPRDGTALVAVHYGPSEVVIDVCPKCSGVWLDRGEFARISKDLEDAAVDKSSVGYLKDFVHEIAELVTGRKSLSEEARDVRETWHLFKNRLAIDHPLLRNFIIGLGGTFA